MGMLVECGRALMSPVRAAVLAFVAAQCAGGASPTLREIAAHFGWQSTNAARNHLWALYDAGLLTRADERSSRPWRVAKGDR